MSTIGQALFLLLLSELQRAFGSFDWGALEEDLQKVMKDNQSFWPGETSFCFVGRLYWNLIILSWLWSLWTFLCPSCMAHVRLLQVEEFQILFGMKPRMPLHWNLHKSNIQGLRWERWCRWSQDQVQVTLRQFELRVWKVWAWVELGGQCQPGEGSPAALAGEK